MPPRKIRIRALNIHKEVEPCSKTLTDKEAATRLKHNASGCDVKTLISKSKKKLEIIN